MKNMNFKTLVSKFLSEQSERLFYLAPDVIGSINNYYLNKEKNILHIDFQTIDGRNMKFLTPERNFHTWMRDRDESTMDGDNMLNFLRAFMVDVHELENEEGDSMNEIVDEYGELYKDNEDRPINITNSPGMNSHGTSDQLKHQRLSQLTRVGGTIGHGGIVW